jgi:hypothetical protein
MITLIFHLHRFTTRIYDHQRVRKVQKLSGGRHAVIAHYTKPDFKNLHIFCVTKRDKVVSLLK